MTSSGELTKTATIISWVCQVVAAVILLQTLYFKLTGAPEPVYIFTTIGMEPWGRYGSAVVELVAGILLFVPSMAGIGAVLALGVISGAIFFHLTTLGIVVMDDGGALFVMALVVFVCSLTVTWLRRGQIPVLKRLG
jgi:putative oxidoreductase